MQTTIHISPTLLLAQPDIPLKTFSISSISQSFPTSNPPHTLYNELLHWLSFHQYNSSSSAVINLSILICLLQEVVDRESMLVINKISFLNTFLLNVKVFSIIIYLTFLRWLCIVMYFKENFSPSFRYSLWIRCNLLYCVLKTSPTSIVLFLKVIRL